MLCSLWADSIVVKVECGVCLRETKKMRDSIKK
jgi:hypothetical protein